MESIILESRLTGSVQFPFLNESLGSFHDGHRRVNLYNIDKCQVYS